MKLRTLAPLGLLLLAAAAYADTAVYDLDAKNASEIAKAIQATLNARCATIPSTVLTVGPSMCHVELLPTSQLIVEAPAPAQSQIAAALKAIAARNAIATPAPRITLQYWVLYGDPGKPDAALKPLSSVLEQLKRVHGEFGFSVQDTATITGLAGTNAAARGGALEINENLRANGDSLDLIAQISFKQPFAPANGGSASGPPQSLSVNVTIKRGEFLVLGERTTREFFDDKPGKGMLFYIVNWPQGQ
jgi:hypothetical protein